VGANLIIAKWLAMGKKGICETRITNLSTIMHFYKKIDCKLLSTIAILTVGNYSEPKHTLC
jgi:hypothetical protein